MSVLSSLFSNVTVPAVVVDGVSVPSFSAPLAAVYAVSHIEGSQWETNILGPMIAAVRAQGAQAEAEATAAAVTAVNTELARITNPLIAMIVEALVDGEIDSMVSSLFAVLLGAVGAQALAPVSAIASAA